MRRAIIIVLDSVGIGELPDAVDYGDGGSNTLGNIAAQTQNFRMPNLEKLGLGNIEDIKGINRVDNAMACYGKMAELSAGKDTITGHWEIAGIIMNKPFPVYPDGFPREIIEDFEEKIGTKILGNKAASGTEIIEELGHQHMMTGYPIVYTSADSVFQIAAHEEIIPVEKLYQMCSIARNMLTEPHAVGRVIARPFTGHNGAFTRTERRHDFSLKPPGKTILDYSVERGYEVKGVGKIKDIFSGQGVTDSVLTLNNSDGVDKTISFMKQNFSGIIFTNLVDFDMLYGHRNDVKGYAEALMDFDARVPEIINSLKENDILFITADHGCDPTTSSTDHSREYVPVLVYGCNIRRNVDLGIRTSFADIGATIADYLCINPPANGRSFYQIIAGDVI